MLNSVKIFAIFYCVFMLFSCKKDDTIDYIGSDNIYFQTVNSEGSDSTNVAFGLADDATKDSLVSLVVMATGSATQADRSYLLSYDSLQTTATNGIDFELPDPNECIIKSGDMTDTIYVKINKTQRIKDTAVILVLKLIDNQNFKTRILLPITVGTSKIYNGNTYKIRYDNVFNTPTYWNDYVNYLGKYSKKKYLLILNHWSLAADRLLPYLKDPYYLDYISSNFQQYLNSQAAKGETIYDEDGSIMKMGPYAQ